MSDHTTRALAAAHRKIGAARKIVNGFWSRKNAAAAYDKDTAWAAHVAMVQLEALLSKGKRNR